MSSLKEGTIYVITTPSFKERDMYKIGSSERELGYIDDSDKDKKKVSDITGHANPFYCLAHYDIANCNGYSPSKIEEMLHAKLAEYRSHKNPEFYFASIDEMAIAINAFFKENGIIIWPYPESNILLTQEEEKEEEKARLERIALRKAEAIEKAKKEKARKVKIKKLTSKDKNFWTAALVIVFVLLSGWKFYLNHQLDVIKMEIQEKTQEEIK